MATSRMGVAARRVERARRRAETAAAVLLIALLPMLTFFGHWEIRFDIPGTPYYFSWPTDSGGHDDPASTQAHAAHCHGEMASCTSSPGTAAAPVALLTDSLSLDIGGAPPIPAVATAWEPAGAQAVGPDTPPPRFV